MIIIVTLKFIDEINVNILCHLIKKKINGGRPDMLIIIVSIISLDLKFVLIHEDMFEKE